MSFGLLNDTVINKSLALCKTVSAHVGQNVDRVLTGIWANAAAGSRRFREPWRGSRHLPPGGVRFKSCTMSVVRMPRGLVGCKNRSYTGVEAVKDITPFELCLARKNLRELVSQCGPVMKLRSIFRLKTKT